MVKPVLTPIQHRFVEAYLKSSNGTQSAIQAGYAHSGASCQATRLLKSPRIQAYMRSVLGSDLLVRDTVVGEIREISRDEKVKASDRLQAFNLIARLMGWLQDQSTNIQINVLDALNANR